MRFFARVTFLCNVCFLVAVALRWVETTRRSQGNFDGAIKFQPLEATLVLLGYSAIFINLFFLLLILFRLLKRTGPGIPRWILYFNALIFPFQVYYFFFS